VTKPNFRNIPNEADLQVKMILKILKEEYICNHCTDLIEILNLSFGDKTKL
jgi:hypothetical protein